MSDINELSAQQFISVVSECVAQGVVHSAKAIIRIDHRHSYRRVLKGQPETAIANAESVCQGFRNMTFGRGRSLFIAALFWLTSGFHLGDGPFPPDLSQ